LATQDFVYDTGCTTVRSQAVQQSYTIGQLASEAGVNVETIRYYQRRKLFPKPKRALGRMRRYGASEVVRLRFIKCAQRLGFTLREIDDLLELLEQPMSCSKTRTIAAAKLEQLGERIRELQALREEFTELIVRCDANPDESRCPIIERFAHGDRSGGSSHAPTNPAQRYPDAAGRVASPGRASTAAGAGEAGRDDRTAERRGPHRSPRVRSAASASVRRGAR
jgi:MerR family mercuric resistance operon transcriptional regulator